MAKKISIARAAQNIEEADRRGQAAWREEAMDMYRMYNGYQWPDADMQRMQKEGKPNVCFNRVAPLIDAMVGMELQGRKEVKFYPRTMQGDIQADMMNAVATWVRQESDQEIAEIDAERDMFITGVGAIDTRMNYEDSELGDLDVERINPMRTRWDASARKRNLLDAKWCARYRIMKKEEIQEVWPDAKLDGLVEDNDADSKGVRKSRIPATYNRLSDVVEGESGLRVWQYYYYCLEPYWKVQNPFLTLEAEFLQFIMPDLMPVFGEQLLQEQMTLSEDGYKKLKAMARDLNVTDYDAVRMNKKIYYKLVYVGNVELQHEVAPVQGHFTLKFVTGKRDETDGCWYGLMRGVRDPQLWANKFLSTLLFIYMHNSKGGVMAEAGAIPNQEEFRREWARPDGIMEVNPGAITNGQIKEKPKAQLDSAAAEIMKYAVESIPAVSGIDPAVVAMSRQNRSNALEDTRIQQTATLLLDYFESMTQYRKNWGKMLIQFTKEYLAQEQRLIRISDAGTAPQFIQLVQDNLADDYDVIAEEGAMTINQKAETWQILSQLFQGQGIPLPLWKYAPIPSNIANEIMQLQQQQQEAQSQQQQQMASAQSMQMISQAKKDEALAQNAQARSAQVMSETNINQMDAVMRAMMPQPQPENNNGEGNNF